MRIGAFTAAMSLLISVAAHCAEQPPSPRPQAASVENSENPRTLEESRMIISLQRRVTWDYRAKPLIEILRDIAKSVDLNVVVDNSGLKDVGLDSKSAVTYQTKEQPMWSALRALLSTLALDYRIEDEVLKISSRKVVKKKAYLVVYPVADLLATVKDGKVVIDFDAVELSIKKATSPKCSVLRIEKNLCLAVTAKESGHRTIAKLLKSIRAARAKKFDLSVH
jgi:hypothetical protein